MSFSFSRIPLRRLFLTCKIRSLLTMHHQKTFKKKSSFKTEFFKSANLFHKETSFITSCAHFVSGYTENLWLELFISGFSINDTFFSSNLEYGSQTCCQRVWYFIGWNKMFCFLCLYFQSLEVLWSIVLL